MSDRLGDRTRVLVGHVVAAIFGAVVAGLVVLASTGASSPAPQGLAPARPHPSPTRSIHTPRLRGGGNVVLAWSPAGLPSAAVGAVRDMRGVESVTVAHAGVDWIERTRLGDGTLIDSPRDGFRIPFDVAVVDPSGYATFVPPAEREAILSLEAGEILLAETAAEIRRGREGMVIDVGRRKLRVAGIVSDVTSNGYEGIVAGGIPASWARRFSFMLIHARNASLGRIENTVRGFLGPGEPLVIRSRGEQPFLRYGDAVQPTMLIKEAFGEFAANPVADGTIAIESQWERAAIRTARVPLLGEVRCHRALFPQLRLALREVRERGLSHLVDPAGFAGCYYPRFINRDPAQRLSHHSWGIALDINVGDNPFGANANQDRRLVEIFERWGFTWGGRWAIPDGMHFEWRAFP